MNGIAELVERMLKEKYVCYSPILGVEEIKVEDFALGFYNVENALFLITEEFGRKPYRVDWIGEYHIEIKCMDDDIDIEYQKLIMSFDTQLMDKES